MTPLYCHSALVAIMVADADAISNAPTLEAVASRLGEIKALPEPHPYMAADIVNQQVLARRRHDKEHVRLLALSRRLGVAR